MHSVLFLFQIGGLNGKRSEKRVYNTIQRTAVIIGGFGTDKSVPYANPNVLRFNQLPQENVTKAERINPFPTNTYRQIPVYRGLCLADGHIIFSPSANSS